MHIFDVSKVDCIINLGVIGNDCMNSFIVRLNFGKCYALKNVLKSNNFKGC